VTLDIAQDVSSREWSGTQRTSHPDTSLCPGDVGALEKRRSEQAMVGMANMIEIASRQDIGGPYHRRNQRGKVREARTAADAARTSRPAAKKRVESRALWYKGCQPAPAMPPDGQFAGETPA
jgi:hypothetical protein